MRKSCTAFSYTFMMLMWWGEKTKFNLVTRDIDIARRSLMRSEINSLYCRAGNSSVGTGWDSWDTPRQARKKDALFALSIIVELTLTAEKTYRLFNMSMNRH